MDRALIERTEAFLKETFDRSDYLFDHPEQKEYRLAHTYRVANIGREIAKREGFDETELVIACLLHDLSYCEEFGENGWQEHGRRAAQLARPFLETLGLPRDRVEDICYGIAIHVDDEADFPGERTAFALSVGDADDLDRFDVYRIHDTLTKDEFLEMSLADQLDYAEERLLRLRRQREIPMGTETAEAMWTERLDFTISFFEKLVAQLRCSMSIVCEGINCIE